MFTVVPAGLSVVLVMIHSVDFSRLCLQYLSSTEEFGDDESAFGKGSSVWNCYVYGLIACVCSLALRSVNLRSGWTHCDEMSACRTKASMNVEDGAQGSIFGSNILYNLHVVAISVKMNLTK